MVSEIEKLKTQGHTAIAIEPLAEYLKALVASAKSTDPDSERHRVSLDLEVQIEAYKAKVTSDIEMLKAVLETGQSALRALSIVNGAAAVAILAFLGNVLSEPNDLNFKTASIMSRSMIYFAFGVGMATLGFAARYFSQACYAGEFSSSDYIQNKWGGIWRAVAIVAGVMSLIAFFFGIGAAARAIGAAL